MCVSVPEGGEGGGRLAACCRGTDAGEATCPTRVWATVPASTAVFYSLSPHWNVVLPQGNTYKMGAGVDPLVNCYSKKFRTGFGVRFEPMRPRLSKLGPPLSQTNSSSRARIPGPCGTNTPTLLTCGCGVDR